LDTATRSAFASLSSLSFYLLWFAETLRGQPQVAAGHVAVRLHVVEDGFATGDAASNSFPQRLVVPQQRFLIPTSIAMEQT
jgi:hypothetical protein